MQEVLSSEEKKEDLKEEIKEEAAEKGNQKAVQNNQQNKFNNEFKKIKSIDFNCDIAQSFGVYKNETEFQMLDYVSSVNVSTGFHAGDPLTIKKALLAAKEKNVVIGAHIGFNDIQGFGNKPMNLSDDEIEAVVIYQVSAIMSFAKAFGLEIEHVRPHGAMYKMASENFAFASAIAKAVKKCSNWLVYYGAAGEITAKVGEAVNIPIAQEIRLDKTYAASGTVDYSIEDITNTNFSIKRLQQLLRTSQVDTITRGLASVDANTVHFSSSAINSLELVKRANEIITPIPVNFNKVQDSGWV
jgi:UPF0271 protein